MKTAQQYILEKFGIKFPEGNINGAWFAENGLPMVVECSCCTTTMTLPSAMVDEEGCVYCSSCAS